MSRSLTVCFVCLALLATLDACRKSDGAPLPSVTNLLAVYWNTGPIKIGQAILAYDKTALNDSLSYVRPPTDRYYEWKTLPDESCLEFWDEYLHGRASITFNCAGEYKIFAIIHDSATQSVVGITDTVTINVLNDTLRQSLNVFSDDELTIKSSLSQAWFNVDITDPIPPQRPPDAVYLAFIFSTTREYPVQYNVIPYTTTINGNHCTYIFADSVKLPSFPFAEDANFNDKVQTWIQLPDITIGAPIDITVGWLGKTYSGTAIVTDAYSHSITWRHEEGVVYAGTN